jgi:glycosyltransferase involved in cell wall biosynthesis
MKQPIRILHVFGRLNRGGAETMIMNLYRNIDRSLIQFDFVVHTSEECDFDSEIYSLGGRVHRLPKYTVKNHFYYKKAWKNFFESNPNYNIIHGHVRSTASIYLKISKKYGLKTISHSHSTSSGTGFSAMVKSVLQLSIKNSADYLFACSQEAGEWLFGHKACKQYNFYILKNAINARDFIFNSLKRSKIRKELGVEDKVVIGHVGRFHSSKNHEFIIDVFKEMYDLNKNFSLLLVGDGELRHLIEKKIARLNLSGNVILVGSSSKVNELLQAFDVFMFPSLYEGLGISVIEAQAAGLPCIVSDKVPSEAIITDLVSTLPISALKQDWVNELSRLIKVSKRRDTYKNIINNGYDIQESSQWLTNFYLNLK